MKNFLGGLAAGLAVGYLTAPRSGKATREQLSETMNGMKDHWDEAKTQITGLVSDIKAQVGKSSPDEFTNEAPIQNQFDSYRNEAGQTGDYIKNRYDNEVPNRADTSNTGFNAANNDFKI